jgi:hypothetical protein
MAATPQHVLASAFGSHLIDFDAAAAAAACKLPIAYIGAEAPMANLSKFREFCPHLKVGPVISPRCWSRSRSSLVVEPKKLFAQRVIAAVKRLTTKRTSKLIFLGASKRL